MASDRARKLINLALGTEKHTDLLTTREDLLPNQGKTIFHNDADENSSCTDTSNNVLNMIGLQKESSLTVPIEDIENYSLVENAQIELIDVPDFFNTFDVSSEEVNMICDRNSLEMSNNVLVHNSAEENFNKVNSNIENCDVISNFSDDLDHPNLVPYSSSSENNSETSLPKKSKTRKRRSQVNKSSWFAEKNKELREKGSQYYGKIKKNSKWVYETVREPKRLKDRCKCGNKTGVIKCATVRDEERITIFNKFWKTYTWGEKKIFVNDTVQSVLTKRPRDRKVSDNSRRAQSFKYHLKTADENYVRVCKTMYLNTLGIGRMTVIAWKNRMKDDCIPSQLRVTKDRVDPFANRQKSMEEFFDSLPTMESHYCRASSSRKYLQPDWKTKMDLYKFYMSDWCKSHTIEPLSRTTFFELMSSKNLSLFRPKKDECEICTRYKAGTMEENDYQLHVMKKEEARKEKQTDKENNNFVFTVDLQAVLMAPKSNVSTLYYKTKLQVHNLCFYDNNSKDGYCFLWHEAEGGLNADEFASIWTYFIEEKILSKVENKTDLRIVIYSDGCGYQNRNVTMSNALLNIAVKNKVTIEQKYLEVGHTQMEVDAMHSLIERRMRNKVINVPADYVQIMESARNNPFDVKYLEHSFFKDFSNLSTYKSIRPGRSTGDPKVTDIRALMYSPSGNISYKLRFGEPWMLLPQRKGNFSAKSFDEMQNLHQTRLKIKARKYNDLQQIKEVLPADFREFYNNLPHD